MQRIFRRTEAGDRACASQDASVPADYRRILGLIATEAHADVIRGALRRHPDKLIDDWLGELEELGLVVSGPAEMGHDLDFTGSLKLPELLAEDRRRLVQDTEVAGVLISRQGVYLAADRLKNLALSRKTPSERMVLVVEDDPDQAALAELRVSMSGYAVKLAASMHEMTEELRRNGAPDLLLLDVMLPDGDGFDILGKLRQHPHYALLPVVMLTMKTNPDDIMRGLSLGADGYITKPYSKNMLADTIARVLKQQP